MIVTVLLEYINNTTCMNIMLSTYYSVDIILNTFKIKLKYGAKTYKLHIPLLNICVLVMLMIRIFVYSLYLEMNYLCLVSWPVFRPYFKLDTFLSYTLFVTI